MPAPPAPPTRFWEYKHAPLQLPCISDFCLPGLPTQPAIQKIQNSKGSEILNQQQANSKKLEFRANKEMNRV